MIKTSYQVPELRDSNNDVVQEGAFGKNTALSNAENTGWIDYVMNDLEALHDTIGDSAATLDGNGHVVEPCNLAIGDEDGNRIKTNYLKLSGGTVTGTTNFQQNVKFQDNQENQFGGIYVPPSSATQQFAQFYSGTTPATTGVARLTLYSDDDNHRFELRGGSTDGSTDYVLTHTGAGALTWRGNELAKLSSPAFTGTPTAPTAATSTNSTQIATTAYVVNKAKADTFLLADGIANSISSNADLNDYTTAGTYKSGSASVTNTLENCPVTSVSIKLVVLHIGYNSMDYGMQLLFTSDKRIYVRNRGATAGSWSTWKKIAYSEDVLALSGGTVTGSITESQALPSTRASYRIQYSSITKGTAPSSDSAGYMLGILDSSGTSLGGLYRHLNSNNSSSIRLYNNWTNTSFYIDLGVNPNTPAYYFAVIPDNTVMLGTSAYRWKQLYAGTTTISTSDERLKTNITDIPNDVLDAWGEVGWVQFQFTESVAEKGETYARVHTGAIAQRIKAVFEAHNLDPFKYGLLCYDEWQATPAERDEQGNITEPAKPAGNRYSLRYEEALCMEAAYQRRRADRLEERIEALERALNS